MSLQDWQEQMYRRVLQNTLRDIALRRASDPGFTRGDLEGLLETAYVDQGNDWEGRGALGDLVQAATIAAYELALADWDVEPSDRDGSPRDDPA